MKHTARMRTVEKRMSSEGLTGQMKAERIVALFRQLDDNQLEIVRDWSSDEGESIGLYEQLNEYDKMAEPNPKLDAAAVVRGI
jgi:hypothetical protein